MSWNFGAPDLTSIKNLVSKEGTTLEEVLSDSKLGQSLRYETEEVVEFFSTRNNIKNLLIWSITTQYDDNPDFLKYSRLSTFVLTSQCIQLQNAIVDSNLLPSAFRNFFRLSPEESPLICGNYQKIVEYFIKVTRGEILEQFPEITTFLIERIQVLPLRLLLFDILTESKEYISDFKSILKSISDVINEGGPTAFGAVGLLYDIFKEQVNPFIAESMKEVVTSLFNFSLLESSTPLYKAQSYILIEQIIQIYAYTKFDDILNSYEDKIDFTSDKIDGVASLRLYPKSHLQTAFTKFFKDTTNCTLGSICLNSIKNYDGNLRDFVFENHILENVIELFPDEKCSGHLTDLALFLSEKIPGQESGDNDILIKWNTFVNNQIAMKKQQISASEHYGGERPTTIGNRSEPTKSEISPITGIVSKTKVSNDTGFNFDSDSDEDSSSDDESNSKNSHHLIHKDPVQDLNLSSSDDEKNPEGEKDKESEEKSAEQEYSDVMMKLWGFSIAPKKKEETIEEEDSYSYNEEDEGENAEDKE